MRVSYNFTGNVQFPYLKDYNMLNAAQKLEYERLAGLYSTEVKRDPWGNITNEGEQYALDKLYNERYQEVQRGVDTDWLSHRHARLFLTITPYVCMAELPMSVTSYPDVSITCRG